ncbi:feruloyl CoA ortho-hydroxylase 1-like [Gossypium australe]|uniref:Feruloyl CoA ortho-hydroxylase 1-like n=1 Tax=Gossypium australe TaxID=47621 RepID=A0A5B6VHC0_9ROSI|nr:feruloyl CoA ortho-hydroxylase 1-like [Gossypium australe]
MAPSLSEPFSDSSILIDFVINQGNGVKGLSEMGLKALPKQYIQPLEERMCMTNVQAQESIPIIDMSNPNDPEVENLICEAASKWGFFQIVNHNVPIEVLENVKDATYKFFGLAAEVKNKYSKEHSSSNNVRFGTSFTPQAEKALEWKDYLSLFYVSEEEAFALWPSVCREQVLDYMTKSEVVIKQLLKVLMKGLNVNEIDETKESLLMGSMRTNLNYYPKCPNPELTVGVGRHSDVSTLTILLQDEIGGLFVRGNDGDNWIHVPPIKGSLVINVGDALQIMSNGKYKSVEHRVVANGSNNRISVPIFVNPRPSDMIGPLPELIENGEKPIYKQVLYSDYVKHFFRKAHDGKKTIVNHDVPVEVLENVKDATYKFFGLPAEVKNKYSKEHSSSNNVRFGTSFTPQAEKALEWKDYLNLFYVSEEEAFALWPSVCREQVLDYMKKSEVVIKQLLKVLMNGLNLHEIDETKELLLMGSMRTNLNYYPKCPNPELTVGVGRHSDVSTLTILLQDKIGGLFVRGNDGDNWIHVPPIKGSLVINVGDALQIISNGKYRSVEHRVVANGSKNRISVPIFVNPRPIDMIGPFPELIENGEKPIYKQVLYSDYVKHFFRKAHDGKKTVAFAEL